MSNITTGKILVSQQSSTQVLKDEATGQHALYALFSFTPGDTISDFSAGSVHDTPSYLTIQTGPDEHITLQPDFLQYVNHSCDPNVFFDTDNMRLICIQPVAAGDELRFFYPSTEWEMAQPFVCNCGCNNCLQLITGAAQLSAGSLSLYQTSSFIKRQLLQQGSL